MNDTTSTMTTTTPASTAVQDERVSEHLRALVDEAEALLKATARAGDQKFDATRERLRDEVRQLRMRLAELEGKAAERVKAAAHQTDEAVHAHPYVAMGAAAVAGLLLGFVLSRR
jgi:ElaB/YqjD/DUF883 family membrane-anchored ribosome-binding protein